MPKLSADLLPAPEGPRPVGRTSYAWTDPSRAEIHSTDPADRRELVVWIWYPAEGGHDDRAPYMPPAWAPSAEFLGLDVDGVRAHSFEEVPLADSSPGFPVLVLSPSGFPPLLLAALAEELASHG